MAGGTLFLATEMLQSRFGPLDDFPDEVVNTIANHCYRWVLLTSEPTLPRIVVRSGTMANNLADGDRAELAWKLDHFAEELTRLRGILRGRGRRAFADACRMFVDRHKYRIADADRKSRLRRTVERLLKRTGEIRELSALMKGGSGHGARWAIPASK